MNKKALLIGMILIIISLALGITYAYLIVNRDTSLQGGSTGNFNIDYTNGGVLSGSLYPRSEKSNDIYGNVKLSLKEGSIGANCNIYIQIDTIDEPLASKALVWELYKNNEYVTTGTFEGYSNNSKLYVLKNYALTTDVDSFDVYIWLNGSEMSNNALNSKITGKLRVDAIARATFE